MIFHNDVDIEEDLFFKQKCLELAKLLRAEQTEEFLRLYDSLPSEWNGDRLEKGKEFIRQLEELDENQFQQIYQENLKKMSTKVQQTTGEKAHHENSKKFSSSNQDETNLKKKTINDVDCFVKFDLKCDASNLEKKNSEEKFHFRSSNKKTSENYFFYDFSSSSNEEKKFFEQKNRDERRKTSESENDDDFRSSKPIFDAKNSAKSNLRSVLTNERTETILFNGTIDNCSRSNSRIFSTNEKSTIGIRNETFGFSPRTNYQSLTTREELATNENSSKINVQTGFTYEKSASLTRNETSENSSKSNVQSGSSNEKSPSAKLNQNPENSPRSNLRTGSSNDKTPSTKLNQNPENSPRSNVRTSSSNDKTPSTKLNERTENSPRSNVRTSSSNDKTPTVILNETTENRSRILENRLTSLPDQESFQLIRSEVEENCAPLACQVPRIKISTIDELSSISEQKPPNLSQSISSSQEQNRFDRQENSTRKFPNRTTKKRKQFQQQEIIKTELIPGHRGDRDVDELMMFIDGCSSKKTSSENCKTKNVETNSNGISSIRRKSRKTIEIRKEEFEEFDEERTGEKSDSSPIREKVSVLVEPKNSKNSPSIEEENCSNSTSNENVVESFFTVVQRRRSTKDRRKEKFSKNFSRPTNSNVEKRRTESNRNFSTKNFVEKNEKVFVSNENVSSRRSSSSSSSSSSSLAKKNCKIAPVVFVNKSIEVELNDVEFGFQLENQNSERNQTENILENTKSQNEILTEEIFQNQQSSTIEHENQIFGHQPTFFFVPQIYPVEQRKTTVEQTNRENFQQTFFLYGSIPNSTNGQFFLPTIVDNGKNFNDFPPSSFLPHTTIFNGQNTNFYPSTMFIHNFLTNPTPFFQPIPSMSNEKEKFYQTETEDFDDDDDDDNDELFYDSQTDFQSNSNGQSSSHIMSNALQLVYSQQRKNTDKNQFNFELLAAHLAMRWADGVNRFEQGDDEYVLVK